MSTTRTPVTLNLDSLEREDKPEPFTVTLGGRKYLLNDPEAVPYGDLTSTQSEDAHYLVVTVDEGQREAFNGELRKLANWKVVKLIGAYNEHYGLPSAGEDPASRTS